MNRKNKFIAFLFLLFVTFLFACEKTIRIDIPESEKKIVINGVLSPDEDIKVTISRSLYILDPDDGKPPFLTNAVVNLFENGQFINTLSHLSNGNYSINYQASEGNTYYFEVNANDLNTATTSTKIPSKVNIKSMGWEPDIHNDIQFTVKFSDPGETENYYLIDALYSPDTNLVKYYNFYISGNEQVLDIFTTHTGQIILSDEVINGKSAEISFYAMDYLETFGIYKINLKNITRDYYLYLKSYTLQYENIDNPFAEPVQVYHNINNGFGILGSFNVSSKTIIIQ